MKQGVDQPAELPEGVGVFHGWCAFLCKSKIFFKMFRVLKQVGHNFAKIKIAPRSTQGLEIFGL